LWDGRKAALGYDWWMTWANGLTFLRLAALGPVILFSLRGPGWLGFSFFLLAWITDLWDGYLARVRGEVTAVGKILDPLADKLLFIGVFSAFAARGDLPWWGPVLYLVPQLGIGVGALYLYLVRREIRSAMLPGKVAAGVTALAALTLFWAPVAGRVLLWISVGASVVAGVFYLLALIPEARERTPEAGGR